MTREVDFLVIGSGLAGLSFALKVAEYGKVCIVTKGKLDESNTKYAQGGIASVTYEPDNFEKHVYDTLISGDGLCDEEIVRKVVIEAPKQIEQLIEWGAQFDRNPDGTFDLAKEGGHSEFRILHHKDITGYEIERALCEKVRTHTNIEILENFFSIDIITQHHLGKLIKRYNDDINCYGAYITNFESRKVITVLSRVTVLATGGCGNIYQTTTNPVNATGDGVSMAYRAKGIIDNMEFIQFHPTTLYNSNEKPSFLITEAMRGHGAVLRTVDGKEFMQKYDKRGSLATRDIVARAIDNEMKIRGDDFVYLDATQIDSEDLMFHFPNIYEKCKSLGIDITKEMIPVVPGAHFQCGGIRVNKDGLSSINRLYALGEVSCTGLHGANRLASNSLIEAVVFAERASKHAIQQFMNYSIQSNIPQWNDEGTTHTEELILITQNYKEMQQVMSNYVGIVRSNLRLKRALDRLQIIFEETEELFKKSVLTKQLCELRNMINVGYLVIKSAHARRESRGLHYTIDYPKTRNC